MKEDILIQQLTQLSSRIDHAWEVLGLGNYPAKITALEEQMQEKDFWSDASRATQISKTAASLKQEYDTWKRLSDEARDLRDLATEDNADKTVNLREEIEARYGQLSAEFARLEFALLFNGEHDAHDAIVAIHAGTGGTDAQDFAAMLLRMYLRFCERKGFAVTMMDESKGAEAGIKSVVFSVSGRYAYGNLRSENGVHRLVRISPFDAEKMRHTSFALVEVIPDLGGAADVVINDEDLKIDVYRASGHGGQGVNTTDSAVRITHLPTGVKVTCQNERSQLQNKQMAMKYLQAKLTALSHAVHEEEKKRLRGEYSEGSWGNQIRSYVLQPYQLVKDHRTDYEETDTQAVLDGGIDGFVEAFLQEGARPARSAIS